IYAAYHAAMVLGRIQDLCPNFAQHVFAISSVSGGSLGAATFAGSAEALATNGDHIRCELDKNSEDFQHIAKEFLSGDFLSPLLWAGLFPDFLQRFIPVPFSLLDRSVGLERGFEESWARLGNVNRRYFSEP